VREAKNQHKQKPHVVCLQAELRENVNLSAIEVSEDHIPLMGRRRWNSQVRDLE
jgi:hypothetical protein